MGGHEHHHEPYKVPDYKIYKVDKTVPELLEVQEALARNGLKDPWMRNEVWRFHPKYGTHRTRLAKMLFRGLPLGLGLFAVTIGVEKALGVDWHNPRNLEKFAHAHGHDEHSEGDH